MVFRLLSDNLLPAPIPAHDASQGASLLEMVTHASGLDPAALPGFRALEEAISPSVVRPDEIEASQGFESAHQQFHGFQRQVLCVGLMAFPLRRLGPRRYPTSMSTARGSIPEGRVRLANQSARLTRL